MKAAIVCGVTALAFLLGVVFEANARGGGRGGGRVSYGGSKHTTSHGGHYSGGSGSSHRGGTYANPRSNNRYGIHQTGGASVGVGKPLNIQLGR
jgi:hypothetical protein